MRSDEDQKTTNLGGILAEEIHKTLGKRLAGEMLKAMDSMMDKAVNQVGRLG